jgi:co-chaperonin GroES (HSP10)
MKSKYLDAIRNAKTAAGEGGFVLPGNLLLVEKLPPAEIKTKSGLIISDTSKMQQNTIAGNAPVQVIVVALGEGFEDEGESIPLDTSEGDILVVGDHSVKWLSTFPLIGYQPDTLGLCSEDQTQIRFRGARAYEAFQKGTENKSD